MLKKTSLQPLPSAASLLMGQREAEGMGAAWDKEKGSRGSPNRVVREGLRRQRSRKTQLSREEDGFHSTAV